MKLVVFRRCRVIGPVVMSCIPGGRAGAGAAACVTGCPSGSNDAGTSLISLSGTGVVVMIVLSWGVFHIHTRRKNSNHILGNVRHSGNIKFAQSWEPSQRRDACARKKGAR